MQYSLICTKCKEEIDITCALKDKPEFHSDTHVDCDGVLETNWEKQKPLAWKINWPRTEDL